MRMAILQTGTHNFNAATAAKTSKVPSRFKNKEVSQTRASRGKVPATNLPIHGGQVGAKRLPHVSHYSPSATPFERLQGSGGAPSFGSAGLGPNTIQRRLAVGEVSLHLSALRSVCRLRHEMRSRAALLQPPLQLGLLGKVPVSCPAKRKQRLG